MRQTKFFANPWINEFDQLIHPGDSVIYAGKSGTWLSIDRAMFDGVNVNSKGEIVSVQVSGVQRRKWISATRSYEDVVGTATLPLMRVYKLK